MSKSTSAPSATILALLQRYSYRRYLALQAGLFVRRGEAVSRPARWSRALRAFFKYPLTQDRARPFLSFPDHPVALKMREEVVESNRRVDALGLVPHKALEKNWDFLNAFSAILLRDRLDDVVVDMGSGRNSVILRWLALYGYKRLYGCDLIAEPHVEGPVEYTVQNIEQTNYPDHFADVITCLSVIEHGVDTVRFLAECERLLKPGGLLIISTDYWQTPLDLEGVEDELGPVHIFSAESLKAALFDPAEQGGLRVAGQPDFTCDQPVVARPSVPQIDGKYTFYFMRFQKAQIP
ncbi:class I SAM-dependent methyltransferase [Aggregatilinea lenta]|uniref:class I SAM-dependent methyltransferase n=1 Tax=Aggregatilinea lenta TaxID=913108 RepID=UPI000E5B3F2C|nr:class I SAM-dependent methyltransferase [Aggregatilinea lenta]